jgi:hypothetical protein
MRIEFSEKILDISDEERERWEEMNIKPKDKRYKWRRICPKVEDIFDIKEINDKETIIERSDGELFTVKGSYDQIKKLVEAAEEAIAATENKEEE